MKCVLQKDDKEGLSRDGTKKEPTGTLYIDSSPSGAEVSVDGVPRGTFTGPERVAVPTLAPGDHTVRCRLARYQDYVTTVTVKAGDNKVVSCNLLPATGGTGTLNIDTGPKGGPAEVSVDGIPRESYHGYVDHPLVVGNLAPGPHTVRCSYEGFRDFETTINVNEGVNPTVHCIMRPEKWIIKVYTSPCCADVFIDEVPMETKVCSLGVYVIANGTHTVRCKCAGYSDYVETVTAEFEKDEHGIKEPSAPEH